MDYIKISDDAIGVVRPVVEPKEETITYSYAYLIGQKKHMETERDIVMGKYNAQIAELDGLIAECVKLGLKEPKLEAVNGFEEPA